MMKKNAFFTFCLACIPGAGQMYCGYMKRGMSIMGLFAAVVGISGFLNITAFGVFLPVIWAYSFFDTWHIRNLLPFPDSLCPDDYIIHFGDLNSDSVRAYIKNRHTFIGILCIAMGVYVILDVFVQPLLYAAKLYWLADMFYSLPTLAVAVFIIMLGLWLVKGTAPAATSDDDTYTKFTAEEVKDDDSTTSLHA